MSSSPRVRFAPSPTGALHLGGIRSALYDWLLAKGSGGRFILRIEDTDRDRLQPESIAQIQDSLRWLGLGWDEGVGVGGNFEPYIQSERLRLYQDHAQQLVEQGNLYPCWCSAERLAELRKAAQAKGEAFKYDRHCLAEPGNLSQPHALRFKVPESQTVEWDDAVRGKLSFQTDDLDDFVALKSDGYPTYNFAEPIDDHLMQISHVLRGDEFIPTTPKNLLVFGALGWTPPIFAHLPQVLGVDKAKLSKRHGAKSVLEYRDEGYLPEAVINYMALLGWNDGSTQEIFSRNELVKQFSLERVHKSPAVFDPERLDWMNGQYIRALPADDLLDRLIEFTSGQQIGQELAKDRLKSLAAVKLVQDRLKRLGEASDLLTFFFNDPEVKVGDFKLGAGETTKLLEGTVKLLNDHSDLDFDNAESLEAFFRQTVATGLGQSDKPGPLFMTLRIALTGQTATPGLFDVMAVLGRETVLRRLMTAIKAS